MKQKLTIYDVAVHAGVSQPTVSKVLNNYPHIKPSTKQKVETAIKELGFEPDFLARSLVTNKTRTIGLIVGDIANPFYAETAKVIIQEAQEYGYEIILLDTDYRGDYFEQCIKTLISKRVDGVMIGSITRKNEQINKLHDMGIPIMLYNRNLDCKSVHFVELDNEKASLLAIGHLYGLGHRRIAFISGPTQYSSFDSRLKGYYSGLREFSLEQDPQMVYKGRFEYKHILQFTSQLLILDPCERPTAFLVANDQMAIAVMEAVKRFGLRIPEDISVVGFDNIDISSNPFIGLTTVSQQKKQMALLAIRNLISIIDDKSDRNHLVNIILEPELIIRKTCGPPKNNL
jgi:LacI family transcriptional regulator